MHDVEQPVVVDVEQRRFPSTRLAVLDAPFFGDVDESATAIDVQLVVAASEITIQANEHQQVLVTVVVDIGPNRPVAIPVDDCAKFTGSDPVKLICERPIALIDVQAGRRSEAVACVIVEKDIDQAIAIDVSPRDAVAGPLVDETIAVGIEPVHPESIVGLIHDFGKGGLGDIGKLDG